MVRSPREVVAGAQWEGGESPALWGLSVFAIQPSCVEAEHTVFCTFPVFALTGPTWGPLRREGSHWGLRQRLLSSAGCQVPTRPARIVPAQYPKPKPSEAGSVWKGGAREWSEKFPSGGFERNGLCDDARQRRKGQFTPNLTRRRKTGEPRRRREVTAGISEEEQTSRRGKPIINHSRQKERRSISTHPRGYIQ